MSVKNRLRLLSLVFIAGLIAIGLVSFFNTKSISNDMENISNQRIPILMAVSDLNTQRMAIRAVTYDIFSYDTNKSMKNELIENKKQREEIFSNIDKNWSIFESSPRMTKAGQDAFNGLQKSYLDWRVAHKNIDKYLDKLIENSDIYQNNALVNEYKNSVL